MSTEQEIFFIIYPRGDRTQISVASLFPATMYEKEDYALASRKEFYDYEECAAYAKQLAQDYSKQYVGGAGKHDFLD